MILVLVEVTPAGEAVETSREAVTLARELSAAGGGVPIDAVVVGTPDDALVGVLASYGVRRVHALTGSAYDSFAGAAWAAGLIEVRERAGSVVVMAAGTPRGNEVLAHVGARTGVPMAANVISFGGLSPFTVTRQVVGGAALEEMQLSQRPAVFTVAGHAVQAVPADAAGAGELVVEKPEIADADLVARVVSTDEPEPDLSGALKSARVVVGAGRGAGSADGLRRPARAGRAPRRPARGVPRRDVAGLAAAPRAGRPDRQPDLARPLHPVRHQRRHPALGGVQHGQGDPGHQHRPGRPDGHQGHPRRDR